MRKPSTCKTAPVQDSWPHAISRSTLDGRIVEMTPPLRLVTPPQRPTGAVSFVTDASH